MCQAEFDVRFNEVEFVADIVALPGEAEAKHLMIFHHCCHGIGQLDLIVFSPGGLREIIKDSGLKNMAGGDCQIRRGFLGRWFLDELIESEILSETLVPPAMP